MKQARLADQLNPASYGVLGNLYSKDGINYLLRNVLSHPTIRAIVLCGPDLTNSGAALLHLSENGVDPANRVRGDDAQIDAEIAADAIDDFRAHVQIIDLRRVNDPTRVQAELDALRDLPRGPFAAPRLFPRRVPAADEFPAEETGFVFRGDRIAQVWVQLLAAVLTFGRRDLTAYTVQQRELLDAVAVIQQQEPDDFQLPPWLPVTLDQLKAYYPQLLSADLPENVAYTYGERLFAYNGQDQVAAMVQELGATRYSRRAVASLWDPARDPRSSDPPCLNIVQARARQGKLYLTAYFRSHDIFRAWLVNAFGLRKLQAEIAARLGDCMLGDLVILSHSAHIYADSWEAARQITRDQAREVLVNPRLVRDPRGSFNIRVEGYQIRVDHYSPEGNLLATFNGSSARSLQKEIAFFTSRIDHAIYLGMELARAELALKHGWSYTQDQEPRPDAARGGTGDTVGGQPGL